jgi:hypothetical protein
VAHFTTVMDVVGLALIVTFAALLWPPLAFLVAGLGLLVISWALTPRGPRPTRAPREPRRGRGATQ